MAENCGQYSITDSRVAGRRLRNDRMGLSNNNEGQPGTSCVVWSDRLETGLPLIDAQHKSFFELAASFNGNDDQVRVMKSLAILTDYIRTHFRAEEILMAAANYPGLEAHCLLHAQFRYMLSDLLGRARKMSMDEIAAEVRYLINGWFYNHIVTVDFEYVPFLVPVQAA